MGKCRFGSTMVMSLAVILIVGLFAVGVFAQENGLVEDYIIDEDSTTEGIEAPEDIDTPEEFIDPSVVKIKGGVLKKFKSVTADDTNLTTSSSMYSTVPGMVVDFTTEQKTKMIITFSANAWASDDRFILVRALADGQVADPGHVQLTGDDDSIARCHSFTWVTKALAPGNHRVKIQWSSPSNLSVYMHKRSMVVMYYK